MRQKIKNFLEKMSKTQRVIFETFFVMIVANLTFIITYQITGNNVFAFAVTAVTVAFAFTAFAVDFAVAAFAFVAVFAFISAFVAVVVTTAFAVFAFAFAAAQEYEIKFYKILIIYFIGSMLLYLSFFCLVPYLSIAVLCLTIIACALVGIPYLPEPATTVIEPQSPYRGFGKEIFNNMFYSWFYNKFVKKMDIPENNLELEKIE